MAKKKSQEELYVEKAVEKAKLDVKEQEEYKKWIEAKFKEVVDHFLLDFVSMSFNYPDQLPNTQDGHVIFTVSASDKYHQLNINIYPSSMQMWKNGQREKLIEGVVHECAHIHTDRLAKLAEQRYATRSQIHDAVEDLTEVVAQYIRMLLRKEAPQIFKK